MIFIYFYLFLLTLCLRVSLFLCCLCSLGHSDVVMGVIVTNDDELCVRMRYLQNGELCTVD